MKKEETRGLPTIAAEIYEARIWQSVGDKKWEAKCPSVPALAAWGFLDVLSATARELYSRLPASLRVF